MEALFRFTMIRPADSINEEDTVDAESETDFQSDLQSDDDGNDNGNGNGDGDDNSSDKPGEDKQGKIKQKALEFTKSDEFASNTEKLKLGKELEAFGKAIEDTEEPTFESVAKNVEKIFETAPAKLVKTEDFRSDRNRLADSIIAVKMANPAQSQWIKQLSYLFKLCTLIERIAQTPDNSPLWKDKEAVQRHLNSMIRLPIWLFPLRKAPTGSPLPEIPRDKERKERRKELRKLREEKAKLVRATNELSRFGAENLRAPQVEAGAEQRGQSSFLTEFNGE